VVECMLALPGQLFSNTQIPACLWFLSKDKGAGEVGKKDRRGEILFIDCRKLGSEQLARTQIGFTDDEIKDVAQTYHRWRETDFSDGSDYVDTLGYCRSVPINEVEKHGFVLTPGRYVGSEEIEDDDEVFSEKMENLTAQLAEQISIGYELDKSIREQLARAGYAI